MAQNGNSYQSLQSRAQVARYALMTNAAFTGVGTLLSAWQIVRLSHYANNTLADELEFDAASGTQMLWRLGMMLLSLTTIVLFLMWLHRASQNLRALGVRDQMHSPGLAIGAWFIPFANLFIPFRIVKEIWLKSDRTTDQYGFLSSDSIVPSFIRIWWGCWVIANLMANFSTRLSFRANTVSELSAAEWLSIGGSLAKIPAAFLAIRVIQSITVRQEESSSAVVNYTPPPPPVYEQSVA